MKIIDVGDHRPEYATIVVRDAWGAEPLCAPPPDLPLLGEHALDAPPSGTIAGAGAGWLHASSRDARHQVRLEAHPAPPPLDEGWDDVVETPYHTGTGAVMLTTLLHGDGYADRPLVLGARGLYRVRVSCRRTPPEIPGFAASAGDVWRMQFWPAPGGPEPPRWLLRDRPALRPGSTGWSRCLGLPSDEVLHAVRIAALSTGRATGDEVAAAYQPWSSGSGDWGAALAGDLSDFAAQLGVPAPATRPDLLRLLVAAGLVIAETDDDLTRYRLAPQPPRAEDVLRLPAGEAAFTALPRPQEQPEPGRVRRMPGDVRSQVHEY